MSFIYMPKPEDNRDFGENPNPGFVRGTLESMQHAIDFGTTNEIENTGRKALDDSQFLTKEQFNKSEYKRPGLNFDNGVHVNSAKRAADRYDKKLEYEQTIGAINNGFLRGAAQFVGGTIGFSVDPSNLLAVAKIPMLVGAKAAPYIMKMAENPLARRAAQAGFGFAEGAAIMAPQEIASFAADNMYGEDPGVLNPLINIGLGGVLGGVIRGFTGFKEPISHNADNVAKQTAVGQMASGKSVRVDELMQHGAYEADVHARMRDAEGMQVPAEGRQVPAEGRQVPAEGRQVPAEGRQVPAEGMQVPAEGMQVPRDELMQLQEDLKPLTEAKLEPATITSLNKTRSVEQAKLKDLETSFSKLSEERKQESQADFIESQQAAMDKIRQIDEQVKNHEYAIEAEKHLTEIQKHLDVLEGKIEARNLREKSNSLFEPAINKPISPKRILEGDYRLEDLKPQSEKSALLDGAKERLQNNVAQVMLDAREAKPLTTDQVKAASEHMQSYKSDSTYNRAESEGFRNEVDALPDEIAENIQHAEQRVKGIIESLPEDVKQSLDAIKVAEAETEKVASALQKIIDCLKGE